MNSKPSLHSVGVSPYQPGLDPREFSITLYEIEGEKSAADESHNLTPEEEEEEHDERERLNRGKNKEHNKNGLN